MRIAISQRVDARPDRNERRDALDQAWGDCLHAWFGTRATCIPLPNRPSSVMPWLCQVAPDLLILSGGNDIGLYPERDASERLMLTHALTERIPVLGVCRGMQMLQHYLGGALLRVHDHIACVHTVTAMNPEHPATLQVNSYHAWGISVTELASDLQPLYRHADGSVEAAAHRKLPWLGVMWHPERTTPDNADSEQWVRAQLGKIMQ